jgi:hypothetical protein
MEILKNKSHLEGGFGQIRVLLQGYKFLDKGRSQLRGGLFPVGDRVDPNQSDLGSSSVMRFARIDWYRTLLESTFVARRMRWFTAARYIAFCRLTF